jgi:GT2 family glycosyltransferase/2-polyprenyl-3-methyl-5-hydroxy-6-metoxy-1,4-benzoquinol methylase/glycosyltransferase involved in cell wall biosynthesis/predicted  nucleic acid-binding Zn-ribbon protein
MEYTGERLIPGRKGLELLELEHRTRYELAVPSARGNSVLDLGCGTGYGAGRLAEVAQRVVGIDLSAEAVEYAQGAFARSNLTFQQGDLTRDELVDELRHLQPELFDVVVCFEVLEHVPEPTKVLGRIKRLLRPSGLLFVSTPNIARPQAAVERDNPFHLVEYSEEELAAVLREHFSSVRFFRQSVHLASRIVPTEGGRIRRAHWRDSSATDAKYFVALCSDLADHELVSGGLTLSTSDAHLMLLQERLAELRKDQQQRNQVIEQMRARLSAEESLRAAIGVLEEDEGDNPEQGAQGQPENVGRILALASRLRDERDSAVKALDGLRTEAAALAAKIQADDARCHDLERQIEEWELRFTASDERLRELRQQIETRTSAGLELSRELERLHRDLDAKDTELLAGRQSLSELQQGNRELKKQLESLSPPPVADSSFVRFFADHSAQADERASRLQQRNEELELQNGRLIAELESRGDRAAGRASDSLLPLDGLHEELATWKRLARDLATELHHVLTSRRWRFAMKFVRLRNLLFHVPEGDAIGGHLNRHLRRAGQEPRSFKLRTADARTIRQSLLGHRAPGPQSRMQLLSEAEKQSAAQELLARNQDVLVSVVMPTWNRGDQIPGAVRSVQNQSYRSWELLIIDDGSTDETSNVVGRFCADDERIRYLAVAHGGVSTARNVGAAAAKGQLIAYLDSDNRWDPDYLLFMVNAVLDSRRMCAYAALRVIDYDQGQTVTLRKRSFDYGALLKNNYIDINVFMHRAELIHELGGFDHELRRWVDWDLILRYVRKHPPEEVPVVLCDYKREARSRQITLEEPRSYKYKVLNKNLIDWEGQRRELRHRKSGLVSVVIPNYDLPEMTRSCVEAVLAAAGPELEVIVVDNGSAPRNRRKLRIWLRRHAKVSMVETYENYGFALGCNLGAAAANGEFVIWLNNDTEVKHGWIEALIQPLREKAEIGIVGPKLLWPDGTLQHGGMVFGPRSKIPYHIYQGFPGDHPAVNKRRPFRVLSGACLAVRAADFVELQGFDPIFLNGCEDLDLCLRMWTVLKKRALYNPAAEVIHYEGKTAGRSQNIQFNRKTFVSKWRDRIEADDRTYYEEDGFVVKGYVKKGAEKDGETALYHPELAAEPAEPGHRPRKMDDALLRVGFVSIWYERGVSYVTRQLALALEGNEGFETHVFARWESQRFRNAGSIFHPRVVNAGENPTPKETVGWARDRQLDLVVFVEIHPNDWKRVEALKRAGFRVLCYEHLDVLRMDMLDRYEQVDGFLANSFFAWDVWRKEYPQKPALALPWGIPPELVRGNLNRKPSSHLRFVHLAGWGGLNNRKNTDLCIEAFHEAAPPGAQLRIFTQAPLETYGEACMDIVQRNPAIQVHVGTLDSSLKVYHDADVLLWPSKREGLGLPILEALASGLPVLISDGYLMKEWPVIGEHAVVCRAREGVVGDEPVRRYLPLLEVDREDLVRRIRELASSRSEVATMTAQVLRDRSRWLWTWQTLSLGLELRRFVSEGGFRSEPAAYIPAYMLEFEQLRAARRGDTAGEPAPETDGRNAATPATSGNSSIRALPQFLFIAGCQRSGTTALLQLLNHDERLVIGRERFKHCRTEINPSCFREDRFFSPKESETNYRVQEFYETLRARWHSGTVRYIGDKVPFYYKDLQYLVDTFPACKILFLIRDLEKVAASYNSRAQDPADRVWRPSMDYRRAVQDWNESLGKLLEFVDKEGREQIFVIRYEAFFSGGETYLEALYEFLELPVTAEVVSAYQDLTCDWSQRVSRPSNLTDDMRRHLSAHRNRSLEERCLDLCPPLGQTPAPTTGS